MTPERWQEIKEVLAGAMGKAPKDRRVYLDQSCPDADVRREVESLIAVHDQGDSNFMEQPDTNSSLHLGTKLGPYEIVSPIGAGAMGEVYRARDTKLGRDVAIKVVSPAFANVPHRLARFQREAKLLASLNHPNIAAIHGFEDSGGIHALVMELVEGPTLADRIVQGPIPIDEALPIAKQIAEGLEYAHEHGVVHRDLKPANIKAAPDGTVKILDFGLAKAMETDLSTNDVGDSPTLSHMATQEGALLGTATYMSPEQAKGRPVDRRADIWAFGCVLYEMLTGETAFPGETMTETLAAVLHNEPDWSQLPAATPLPVRALLRRCLQKDLRRRQQAIGDARVAIEEYLANPNDASLPVSAAVTPVRPLWRRTLPWAVAALLALAFAVSLFALLRAPAAPTASVASLDVNMGKLNIRVTALGDHVAISPNGHTMVFLATESGSDSSTRQLYLRSMDREGITPLPGTQGANQPFFSPDGQWVGFSANGKLEKVPVAGGLPVTLCDASGTNGVAATWAENNFIFFITPAGKVDRVPAGGGTPQPVAGVDPGKLPYRWISSLPGGHALLLVATKGLSEFDIDVLSLETGKSKRLIDGGSWPRYLPTGQILYAQYSSAGGGFTGGLLAVPFDLKSLAVTGSPVPVMEGVATYTGGAAQYDVAADGTLAYAPGGGTTGMKRLAWLNPDGKIEPLPAPPGNYSNLSISPSGKRVAMTVTTGSSHDIYIYDVAHNTTQRLTFGGTDDDAIFTPDGSRVIYDSTGPNGGAANLWMRAADGSGNAERLTTSKFRQVPSSILPNGKLLAYFQANPKTGFDIYVMPLQGGRKPRAFIQSPYDEFSPTFSPDGKWIAYESNESGSYGIYVQAFPGPGGKHQIPTGGARYPTWSRNGKKLYYDSADSLMEVDVTTRPAFSAGTPRLAAANMGIPSTSSRQFDVAPDGRILFTQSAQQSEQGSSLLHVVLHFATEVQNRLHAAQQ